MKEIDVVCGVIQKEDQYLVARRGKGVDEGFDEFPGGKVEKGESFEEAIQRELKEELDIEVNVLKHLLDFDDVRSDRILHLHAYLCEIKKGKPTLSVHTDLKWIQIHELSACHFQKADQVLLQHLTKNERS